RVDKHVFIAEQTLAVRSHSFAQPGRKRFPPRGKCVHPEDHSQLFKLAPEWIEFRKCRVFVMSDDWTNEGGFETAPRHPPQFFDGVIDVLYRENRRGIESLHVSAAIIEDPVVIRSRADMCRLGVIDER